MTPNDHCFRASVTAHDIIVRLGVWDRTRTNDILPVEERRITKFVLHPLYGSQRSFSTTCRYCASTLQWLMPRISSPYVCQSRRITLRAGWRPSPAGPTTVPGGKAEHLAVCRHTADRQSEMRSHVRYTKDTGEDHATDDLRDYRRRSQQGRLSGS